MSALRTADDPGCGVVEFRVTPYDDPVAAALVATLQQVYVARYGGGDSTPVNAAEFAPPYGLFLVGRLDGVAMSCGGWRLVPSEAGSIEAGPPLEPLAEIKRMYVAEGYRGRGLSRVVLSELEATARAAGVRRIRLETGHMQPEAIRLYETSGYERIEGFGVHCGREGSNCFGKAL